MDEDGDEHENVHDGVVEEGEKQSHGMPIGRLTILVKAQQGRHVANIPLDKNSDKYDVIVRGKQ